MQEEQHMELLPDTDYTLKLANIAATAGNGSVLIDLVVGV